MLFYVLTDSADIAKKYFEANANGYNYVFVADLPTGHNGNQPLFEHDRGTDLAVMSMADSAIFTHGTFGYFGTILTKPKKKVLYPTNYKSLDAYVSANLSNWEGIDWQEIE